MSTDKQTVTVRDLAEEAKKRIVILIICMVGLSYLMSLTSSSVWVNLPGAATLIIILRYLAMDFEMRRKAAVYNNKQTSENVYSRKEPAEGPRARDDSGWRRKVDSPVVEDAIDHFTKHLISEWVTDLWYSRITPDRQVPEELVLILNGVLGEISARMRNVNLIDLLTRDIINLFRSHLELFRASQGKIERQKLQTLTFEGRDSELKLVLAADNKLHPAVFSVEAEHKVLQHLMDGLVSLTFKREDLQCSLFRFLIRELLACTVMRPVLNLANPRFINERIESLVVSSKAKKETTAQVAAQSKSNDPSRISPDHFSRVLDPSAVGVELVQVKKDQPKTADEQTVIETNAKLISKDPLLCVDTRSTHSLGSLPLNPQSRDGGGIQRHQNGGEWGNKLDLVSRRKTDTLTPENFENMWTKGKNYKRKEASNNTIEPVTQRYLPGSKTAENSKLLYRQKDKGGATKMNLPESRAVISRHNAQPVADKFLPQSYWNISSQMSEGSIAEEDEDALTSFDKIESGSASSSASECEDISSVTGLDSPGTKVWDGKNNRNMSATHIHHPLELSEGWKTKKTVKGQGQSRLRRTFSERKRSRVGNQDVHFWHEVERTSFVSGDGKDILNSLKVHVKDDDTSDDSEGEMIGRLRSGTTASSSASSSSLPGSHKSVGNSHDNSLLADSFWKLRCEVLGANIVKSGSRTFAVYSISVTDINNNSWSIKRRFSHFEELHRRLKEFQEYNLHLPPKHFLSTGLDVPVIQERCKLLDQYLKKLLQFPTISGSIEVWDFLSVDSQTYIFSDSISIIETLSASLHDTPHERNKEAQRTIYPLSPRFEQQNAESRSPLPMKHNVTGNGPALYAGTVHSHPKKPTKENKRPFEANAGAADSDQRNVTRKSTRQSESNDSHKSSQLLIDTSPNPPLPAEWIPPNLTIPILDLVDVVFQLQDGGWIRRQAFWVLKQVLQLGMGDAVDDWLIEKIQVLRRGSVVASGIKRVEQILWPDGIFLTKHPKRQPPANTQSSPQGHPPSSLSSPKAEDVNQFEEQQRKEAEQRAKFVYEQMIDNAPAAVVSVFGRKEYEQCAKDLYYFLQSSVCLKQFAYDLLELLLVSAFPEMDHIFRPLHEDKEKFGEFRPHR